MIGDIFGIGELICKLLILMVAGIFKLVSGAYQIFLVLAKTNIFEQDTYAHLTDKVYIILAVTMLFVVAYTFITLIIDPDKNKGGKAVEDLIKKSVTSLILIVLCPTLFTLAFDLQDAIMDQDIIGKFFTSETSGEEETKKSVKQGGNLMAGTTFAAFFYPTFESTTTYELKNQSEGKHLKKDEYEIDCSKTGSCTLQEAIDYASATGTFSVFTAFAKNWLDGEQQKTSVDFNMLLALIAGFYLLWVIISFCFDLAIRVIKLAFYQVIAPICIACRMLPDKDSIFKNWWKAVCKTYLSIFIRVFIMNLAVFLMVELTKSNFWSNICNSEEMECGGVIKFLAFAFLVLGLVTFIKQASKLIDEIFGLGDVKLGITDKLKEGGGFAAASMARGGIRGTAAGFKNGLPGNDKWSQMKFGKKVGTVLKATGRGMAVGAGAMVDGLGRSTGGFGTDKFVQEWQKSGATATASAKQAEGLMERTEHLPGKIKEIFTDAPKFFKLGKEKERLEKELEELRAQLKKFTDDHDLEAAAKLKIQLDETEAKVNEAKGKLKAHLDKEKELKDDLAKAEDYRKTLRATGATAEAIASADKAVADKTIALKEYKDNYDKTKKDLEDEINKATAEQLKTQADYDKTVDTIEKKYKVKYSEVINAQTTLKAQIDKIDMDLSMVTTEMNNNKYKDLMDSLTDDINRYCLQNPSGILEILEGRLDSETKSVEKLTSKYNHAITVNMEDALKKNDLLRSCAGEVSKYFFETHKTSVQGIESIARNLKTATTYDEVVGVLGPELSGILGIDKNNFTQYQQAFVDTIENPYHKEVVKHTADLINGLPLSSKISVDPSQQKVIFEDLDSEDVRTEEYKFKVAYEAIYGKGTDISRYSTKKDIKDSLRKSSRSGKRNQERHKIEEQIFKVNTEDKKP